MTVELDKEIADAFALLAVLVAFEFAFLAYLLSVLEGAIQAVDPLLSAVEWKSSLGRARWIEYFLGLLGVSMVLVLGVTARLTWKVVVSWQWPWEEPYVTSHGGLVLVGVFLIATVVVAFYSSFRTKSKLDSKVLQHT